MLGSVERKEFNSELEAWNWVHETYKGKQWFHDNEASKKAGYEIYRDTEEFYNYICCLGDRLEVNLKEGNQTINLWIKQEDKDEIAEAHQTYNLSYSEVNKLCDALYLCANAFASNDIQTMQYKNVDDIINKLNLIKMLREGWENI